jgi:tripartite-type tricarboxylate transporter receptor subunit TctC
LARPPRHWHARRQEDNALDSFATAIWRRSKLAGAAAAPRLPGAPPGSAQGSCPDRPVPIIVPFASGSCTDIIPRTMAQGSAQHLGRPAVVTTCAGAATVVGTEEVARAPADGDTLLFTTVPCVVNLSLGASMPMPRSPCGR